MKTKEEIIKEAYGKHWDIVKDFVDENGNCLSIKYEGDKEFKNHPCLNDMGIYKEQDFAHVWYDSNLNAHLWRPKSLDGIETNNGWVVLNKDSYDELENGYYMWYNQDNGDWEIDDLSETHIENYTHFQLIQVPPNPPIY